MKFSHIKAMFWQEAFISYRSVDLIMDVLIFPAISLIVFGFLALFLSSSGNSRAAHGILVGMLLWQVVWIVGYTIPVGCLWNIWSRNLSNLFIAPLSLGEYIVGYGVISLIKAAVVLGLGAVATLLVFHFNLLDIGVVNLILFFFNLGAFAATLGLMSLALIFRYGTRIQSLAWGTLPLFQPVCAVFYPVSVLPGPLQTVARLLPPTYIFEAARASLVTPGVQWRLVGLATVGNVFYLAAALLFFRWMFKKSKNSGEFARLEG